MLPTWRFCRVCFTNPLWGCTRVNLQLGRKKRATTEPDAPKVRATTDQQQGCDFRMLVKPICERVDFAECAKLANRDAPHFEVPALEEYKEMTVWRGYTLCDLKEIKAWRQRHRQSREPANFESAYAK